MMNAKHIAMVVLLVLVGIGGGFYGGIKYDQSKTSNKVAFYQGNQQGGQGQGGAGRNPMMNGQQGGSGGNVNGGANNGNAGGNGPRGRMGQGGGMMAGEVISKDDKSFNIKTLDGGSKIVFYSDTTTVAQSTPASASNVTVGQQVRVNGAVNADGSVAAANIQIEPSK